MDDSGQVETDEQLVDVRDAAEIPTEVWRALVSVSRDVTILIDDRHRIRFYSVPGAEPTIASADDEDLPVDGWIHPDDWPKVAAAFGQDQGDGPARTSCRWKHEDRWIDLRCSVRVIDAGHHRWLIVTVRNLPQGVGTNPLRQRRQDFERVLDGIQQRFIQALPAETNLTVTWALAEVAQMLGAQRGWVMAYDHDNQTKTMTHMWMANRVPPQPFLETLVFPLSYCRNITETSLAGQVVALRDVATMPASWETDRQFLEQFGVAALLALPLIIDGVVVGDVGFHWTFEGQSWDDDDLAPLTTFASSLAHLLQRERSSTRLAEVAEQFQVGFEASPVAMALITSDGTILQVSNDLCEFLDGSPEDYIDQQASVLFFEDEWEHVNAWLSDTLDPSGGLSRSSARTRLVTRDGTPKWALITPRALPNHADGWVLRIDDHSQMRAAEEALGESEARYEALVNNLPLPVIRLHLNGTTAFANNAARAVAFVDDRGQFRVTEAIQSAAREAMRLAAETRTIQVVSFDIQTKDGERCYVTRFVPEITHTNEVRYILTVSMDFTERRNYEAELSHRATHDALTDLPNRSQFLSTLSTALDRLDRDETLIATLFLDLDRFKMVNDSLGHSTGDQLLVAIARRLAATVGPNDVVARLGGDEFTVLLCGRTTDEEVLSTADALREALTTPVTVGSQRLQISCSIGIALAHTGEESAVEMMQWADAAMYRAKEQGRNRISFFDKELAAAVHQRLELDQRLRRALERREFEVHFQPEVEFSTGRIVGAEALLRWRTDEGVIESAANFVALAEDTGLIIPVGTFVLKEACRQAAEWNRRWPDRELIVRVNLSARQLDDSQLVDLVTSVLESTGLPPGRLCLEITETEIMRDAESSCEILEALDELGVGLAVDDFGTGYSSLAYLKQFPVGVLKIDRSFVEGLPESAESTAIVTTIIGLARSLGMDVTAEGIETVEQRNSLIELGCDHGQGFLLARPMPAAELNELLATDSIQ